MTIEEIPVKLDKKTITDAIHQLSAAEFNAVVDCVKDLKNNSGNITSEEKDALNELIKSKDPITVTVTLSNGDVTEIGKVYSPTGYIYVSKGGSNITSQCTFSCNQSSVSFDGNKWTDSINRQSDTVWKFTIQYQDRTVVVNKALTFRPYLYKGVSDIGFINAEVIRNLPYTLSSDTTLDDTYLPAGKSYIFACKGDVNLVCRDASSGAIIYDESGLGNTGLIKIQRRSSGTKDTYSFITVPSSEINWTFKITNK